MVPNLFDTLSIKRWGHYLSATGRAGDFLDQYMEAMLRDFQDVQV